MIQPVLERRILPTTVTLSGEISGRIGLRRDRQSMCSRYVSLEVVRIGYANTDSMPGEFSATHDRVLSDQSA